MVRSAGSPAGEPVPRYGPGRPYLGSGDTASRPVPAPDSGDIAIC
ncbi:hypothetical protein T261_2062 [Streptomyces lydicus]|nr:hypothetical protein T261_2062 [Streptomyces lydicus]